MTTAVEGVWKFDFLGGHGWETVGTLVLVGGRVGGGSATHCTTGTYEALGDAVTMHTVVQFYGTHKPFFGSKASRIPVTLEGTLNGDTIRGTEFSPEARAHSYDYRLIKQHDMT